MAPSAVGPYSRAMKQPRHGLPSLTLAAAVGLAAVSPGAGLAATPSEFDWSGKVANGATVEIKNPTGSIFVQHSEDGAVSVRAIRKSESADPSKAEIKVLHDGANLVLCTSTPDAAADCSAGPFAAGAKGSSAYQVDELVTVPAGVNVVVRGIDGQIVIENAPGKVDAQTVNGDIHATLEKVDPTLPMSFRTQNGSIAIEAPAGAKLVVKASAPPGNVSSSFPMEGSGTNVATIDAQTANGTITVKAKQA